MTLRNKFRLFFSIAILVVSIILASALGITYREFYYAREHGTRYIAYVQKKENDKTRYIQRYGPKGIQYFDRQYFKFKIWVAYPVDSLSGQFPYDKEVLPGVFAENTRHVHLLYYTDHNDWDTLDIGSRTAVYAYEKNGKKRTLLAGAVEHPDFFNEYFYIVPVLGLLLIISIFRYL